VEPRHYNDELYRDGHGWLPAHVEELAGDASRLDQANHPLPSTFINPGLALFREELGEEIARVRVPRWWKVSMPGRSGSSVPVGMLANGDPLFVERTVQRGRMLLCTVPLDDSWHSDLISQPAFVALAHELIYYLAGARSADYNLQPGQPLRYWADSAADLEGLVLRPPNGPARRLPTDGTADADNYPAQILRLPRGMMLQMEGTPGAGVYRLRKQTGPPVYYVAQTDPRESDLTPCDESDRSKVAQLVPITYVQDRHDLVAGLEVGTQRREMWWPCLLGVVALLCGEVWMTRRLVKGR
jgi:hypothetical protein